MNSKLTFIAPVGLALALSLAYAPAAQAGLLDVFSGGTAPRTGMAEPGRTEWQLGEFSLVHIVPEEGGAAPNQQPVTVSVDGLSRVLGSVVFKNKNQDEALFGQSEIQELAPAIAHALATARPDQDIVFSSASRRNGAFFMGPTAVTGRIFVSHGQLDLIIHDARNNFYDQYRGSLQKPVFNYGGRDAAGNVTLSSPAGVNKRADWLQIALGRIDSTAPLPPANAAATPPAPAGAANMGPTPAPAQPYPRNSPEGIEHRLQVLKDAYQRGLITKQEYDEKRTELLKEL